MDITHGKSLMLNPADKSALLLEEPPAQGGPPKLDLAASMIEYMRGLAQKEGEPAGEKVIGDVRARGFRVKEQGQDMTVWIDLQKRLPLLVEVTGRAAAWSFASRSPTSGSTPNSMIAFSVSSHPRVMRFAKRGRSSS